MTTFAALSLLVMINESFIQHLIKSSFGNNHSCLYYLSDNSYAMLKLEGIHILTATISDIKGLRFVSVKCNGYVLASNDINALNSMLTIEAINLHFKSHQRVLLFTDQKIEAQASTALHDVDLLTVNGTKVFSVADNETVDHATRFKKPTKWLPEVVLKKFKRKLCVTLFRCPPFVVYHNESNSYEGVDVNLLSRFAAKLPLHFRYHEYKGVPLFPKVQEDVMGNKCDIGMCSQWSNNQFEGKIEMSHEYTLTAIKILVPRSVRLSSLTFVFQPFKLSLWLATFATIALFTLTLAGASSITGACDRKSHTRKDLCLPLLLVLRIFAQSSGAKNPLPHQVTLRLLVLCWTTACMLISTYYSAGLTISLRFPRFSPQIDTFQQMLDHDVKWLAPDAFFHQWMAHTSNPVLQRLAQRFEQHSGAEDINARLRKHDCSIVVKIPVQNWHNYVMSSEGFDGYVKRNFKALSESLASFYSVYLMKMNSPYVDIVNRAVAGCVEHGFVSHWFNKQVAKAENLYMNDFFSSEINQEVHQNIDMGNIQGAFHLLFVGHTLGMLVFCLESFVSKC